jgi:hypothetical protein
MATNNRKEDSNYRESVFINGQVLDDNVSLNRACKKFFLVAPANSGADDTIIICFISQSPLGLQSPLPINLIPNNLQAIPLMMSRLGNSGNSDECPMVEFECPFTDFYLNAWGITPVDGSVVDVAAQLICSDTGIKQLKTHPGQFIQVG